MPGFSFDAVGFERKLLMLSDARAPQLGARPPSLCSSLEVLLRIECDEATASDTERQCAMIDAVMRGLSLPVRGVVRDVCPVSRELVVTVLFDDCDEGLLARESLLDSDVVTVDVGGQVVNVYPCPLPARVPVTASVITLYRVPHDLLRAGLGSAFLDAAGYGREGGFRVLGEFLGDPPGGPSARRAGSLPNIDVVVLIVLPPPCDPDLACLPSSFTLSWESVVRVRVRGARGGVQGQPQTQPQRQAQLQPQGCPQLQRQRQQLQQRQPLPQPQQQPQPQPQRQQQPQPQRRPMPQPLRQQPSQLQRQAQRQSQKLPQRQPMPQQQLKPQRQPQPQRQPTLQRHLEPRQQPQPQPQPQLQPQPQQQLQPRGHARVLVVRRDTGTRASEADHARSSMDMDIDSPAAEVAATRVDTAELAVGLVNDEYLVDRDCPLFSACSLYLEDFADEVSKEARYAAILRSIEELPSIWSSDRMSNAVPKTMRSWLLNAVNGGGSPSNSRTEQECDGEGGESDEGVWQQPRQHQRRQRRRQAMEQRQQIAECRSEGSDMEQRRNPPRASRGRRLSYSSAASTHLGHKAAGARFQ